MGVQPPTDGLDEGPEVVEFGIAALEAQLNERDSLSFPATVERIREEYGEMTVPIDAYGTETRLADALEELDVEQVETQRELLNELHPVFERRREQSSRSVLAQLRALVPF